MYLFACLLALISAIGTAEFYRMALPERTPELWLTIIAGTSLFIIPFAGESRALIAAVGLLFIGSALLYLFRISEIDTAARDTAYALLAIMYIPFLLLHLLLLRMTTFGVQWLFVIMLIVMTNDTAAFYTGSLIGKNRLYPLVSPKKSIEGAVGGLFGSIAGALIARFTFFPQLTLADAVITALAVGIVGQTGDLFESMLKRSFGVKDSGTLIPGHGGVLDRLDSILFAAPVTYYYVLFLFRG